MTPSKSKSTSGAAIEQGAVELLKADHRAVEALFKAYEASKDEAEKTETALAICLELSIHATIEEEILYPALRGSVDDDMLDEAYVEHDGAKLMIAELMDGSPKDDFYDAKVAVLEEEIKHHVKEEEGPKGLFAQAESAGVDMKALGRALAKRQAELSDEFEKDGIPPPVYRTMAGADITVGATFE